VREEIVNRQAHGQFLRPLTPPGAGRCGAKRRRMQRALPAGLTDHRRGLKESACRARTQPAVSSLRAAIAAGLLRELTPTRLTGARRGATRKMTSDNTCWRPARARPAEAFLPRHARP